MGTELGRRRMPIGTTVWPGAGVDFRVWAPRRRRVAVVLEGGPGASDALALQPEEGGYFAGRCAAAGPGTFYRFRLDEGNELFPDPASRFQPEGPFGPSQVIDPGAFTWTDAAWSGCSCEGQAIYEMHIGTFTSEGTYAAAARELPALVDLGITVIELMPVADFPGRFGWGYDGVNLFAPTRLYGRPDDLRHFVDRAHALGLGVILDVVYNHVGPDGNFLREFAPHYFSDRYKNEWGEAINFDDEHAGPVREFFIANAGYWIEEFHMDGLRLDATQQIFDASADHIIAAVGRQVRAAAGGRLTLIVAENERQETRLVRTENVGGYGLDMLWNDDYHHSAMVALTGHSEAYYSDYRGKPQEFISAAKWGYLYQGQRSSWQKAPRGTPAYGVPPTAFVNFLQNHDQVANSARGLRCHQIAPPGLWRALTALTILMPGTPMLFQGDEFAASSPFLFFADHNPELARLVAQGRAKFLTQFPSIAVPQVQASLSNPADLQTFTRCKLDQSERGRNVEAVALHRDLLRLRREDPVLRAPKYGACDGAVLSNEAFVLRFFSEEGDRLLVVNLGPDLHLGLIAEPLVAPPEERRWQTLWSSEDIRYGGLGSPVLETQETWVLPGRSAMVLGSVTILSGPDIV